MKRLMIVITTNYTIDDTPSGLDAVMRDPELRKAFITHILNHDESGEVVITWDLKEKSK